MKRLAVSCAVCMAAGVLLAGKTLPVYVVACVLLASGICFGPRFYLALRRRAGDRMVIGTAGLRLWLLLPLCMLLCGFMRQEWMLARMNGLFAPWNGMPVSLTGWVAGEPQSDLEKTVFTIALEPSADAEKQHDNAFAKTGDSEPAEKIGDVKKEIGEHTAPTIGTLRATLYGPAGMSLPGYGERVRISGVLRLPDGKRNPGGFDMAMYLAARGMQAQMTLDGLPELLPGKRGNVLSATGIFLKKAALAQLTRFLPKDAAPVMAGMLLGETSAMDPGLRESFRIAGLSHIMAVSGANIAFLLLPLMWLFKRFGVNLRRRSAAALPLLFLYVLMTGFDASIVRAAVMAVVMLAGGFLWRRTDLAASLSVAFILMLASNSAWLFDAGFQLSFLATAAIGLFHERLSAKLPKIVPKTLKETLAGTLAAQAGVMPVLTGTFHSLSLLSIPANLLVVPLTGFLTLAGTLLVIIGLVLPIAGAWIGQMLGLLITLLVGFVTWTAAIPGAAIPVASPPVTVLGLYAFWLAFLRFGKQWMPLERRRMAFPIAALASIVILGVSYMPNHRLEVIVADVGQGDGILLRTPAGKSILIDGGGSASDKDGSWAGERIILPMLQAKGILTPDLVISTHPHADHVQGLRSVVELAGAGAIVMSADGERDAGLEAVAWKKNIPVRFVSAGDVLWSEPEFMLKVLSPEKGWFPEKPDANETSLVLWLEYREFSMLLAADTGDDAETRQLEIGIPGNVDVLKVGHHGARTSTGTEFLQVLRPEIAVISVGRNRYGHPAQESLTRLQEVGSSVHITRQGGAFLLETDGRSIFWRPFVRPVHSWFDGLYR